MFEYILGLIKVYQARFLRDYYYKVVFSGTFLEAIVFLVDPFLEAIVFLVDPVLNYSISDD